MEIFARISCLEAQPYQLVRIVRIYYLLDPVFSRRSRYPELFEGISLVIYEHAGRCAPVGSVEELIISGLSLYVRHIRGFEYICFVELRGIEHPCHLFLKLGYLAVDILSVTLGIGAVGSLDGKLVDAVDHILHLHQSAVCGLAEAHTVFEIVRALIQSPDALAHFF